MRQERYISAYVATVTAAGVGLTAYFATSLPTEHVASLLVLIAVAAVSQFMTLSLFGSSSISLSFPFTFLSLLWFGPGAAILTNAAAVAVHAVYPERRPMSRVAFNYGSLSLAAGLAGVSYIVASGQVPPEGLTGEMFPALVAVTIYFMTNTLAVSGAISLASGQSLPKVFASQHRWLSVYYGGLALGALIVATTFSRGDNLAFLFFVPALAVPWAFTRLIVVRAKELMEKRLHVDQLAILQRVGLKANSSQSLDEVLEAVIGGARDLVSSEAVAVFLNDPAESGLSLASHEGLEGQFEANPEIRLTESDLEGFADGAYITKQALEGSDSPSSAIYLPLRIEDRLLGSLGLFFKDQVRPSGARFNLLGSLAEYAASAVDRQAKSRELELSRQRLFQSQEMVRRQVSGALHGPVQTRLLVVWHRLGQLETQLQSQGLPAEHQTSIRGFRSELMELQEYVRSLSSQLYPPIVKVGLLPALRSLGNRFEGVLKVDVVLEESLVDLDRQKRVVSEDLRLLLYRVAEEALTNVGKHAEASHVEIKGHVTEGLIELSLTDDGKGFTMNDVTPGLGVNMIKDYVDAARGTADIDSAPGHGTTVRVRLPIDGLVATAGGVHELPTLAPVA